MTAHLEPARRPHGLAVERADDSRRPANVFGIHPGRASSDELLYKIGHAATE
jgi:hypothetical protein